MSTEAATNLPTTTDSHAGAERRRRAADYPLARWYLRPAATWFADVLCGTPVRPIHLTLCGLLAAMATAAWILMRPEAMPWAGLGVLAWWFFDRADGQLARAQGTATALGAWLDGNIDELVDIGLHVAIAAALAAMHEARWPWLLLAAFLAGKYLLMHGLLTEPKVAATLRMPQPEKTNNTRNLPAALYHLPANADVRAHLLVVALATGTAAWEMGLVAVYYNLRWMVRYALVARRLGGNA